MSAHSYDQSVLAISKILGEELHLSAFYPQPDGNWSRQHLYEHADEALS